MYHEKTYRAGASIEDYCRACKTDRMHTVIVVDSEGKPARVSCGYCGSEHNFRSGPRIQPFGAASPAAKPSSRPRAVAGEPFATVTDRERSAPAMSSASDDLELLLRRIIREEAGVSP